jgi:hypothetical protein
MERIATGINELTHFHIKEVHDEVMQFINHPKVKFERNTAIPPKLFNFEGLQFLDFFGN